MLVTIKFKFLYKVKREFSKKMEGARSVN